MVAAGEKLVGPYVWGRYDLLVLPPTFPYGGMENPCLTFVTPTLLVCIFILLVSIKNRKFEYHKNFGILNHGKQ